jgi:hypothetical protein
MVACARCGLYPIVGQCHRCGFISTFPAQPPTLREVAVQGWLGLVLLFS